MKSHNHNQEIVRSNWWRPINLVNQVHHHAKSIFATNKKLQSSHLFMIAAGIFATSMGICVKFTKGVSFFESSLVRSIVVVFCCLFVSKKFNFFGLPKNRGKLLARGILGSGGILCYTYGILHLRYSETVVIQQLAPIFTMFLGNLVFGDRIYWYHGFSALFAFVGIGVLLETSGDTLASLSVDYLVPFIGTWCAASAYTIIRILKKSEPAIVVINSLALSTLISIIPVSFFLPQKCLVIQILPC